MYSYIQDCITTNKVLENIGPNVESTKNDILKDIPRTYVVAGKAKEELQLFRILMAFAYVKPCVGYCQGMNSVAGILLIVSKGNQEESFAMLEHICITMGGKGLFEFGFPLVIDLCQEFHINLKRTYPLIDCFFKDLELDDNL